MTPSRIERLLTGSPRLDDALKAANALGCVCRQAEGTGDVIVTFNVGERSERVNCRRKDAPRHLIMRLRQRLAANAQP